MITDMIGSRSFMSDEGNPRSPAFWLKQLPIFILFSICTELRMAKVPVGIGEVGLLLLLLAVLLLYRDQLLAVAKRYRPLVGLWGIYLVTVIVAGGYSYAVGRLSTAAWHDFFAFGFATSIAFATLLLLELAGGTPRLLALRLSRYALALALVAFLLLTVDYLNRNDMMSFIFRANSWWTGRFNGWAQDPNQWAFMLMLACILAVMYMQRYVMAACVTVGLWLLLEARSDAAVAGFTVFVGGFALLSLWQARLRRSAVMVLLSFLVVMTTFKLIGENYPPSLPLRAVGAVVGVEPAKKMLGKGALALNRANLLYTGYGENKLDQRKTIWENSLKAWKASPVVGLGPGAYAGMEGPFQNTESHNLILQLLVNSGLVGVAAALAYLVWLSLRLWRSPEGQVWLVAVAAVLVQGMGQYMARHPLFWVFIALATWYAVNSGRTSAETIESPATTA
jgi:O-antigen ligase